MKQTDIKTGHFCRTIWNDGARDGLIVGKGDNVPNDSLQVYFPDEKQVETVEYYQVIEVGNKLQDLIYLESGLSGMKEVRKEIV